MMLRGGSELPLLQRQAAAMVSARDNALRREGGCGWLLVHKQAAAMVCARAWRCTLDGGREGLAVSAGRERVASSAEASSTVRECA
eukprot:scaffold49790_cov21-Tisochrysis_lutea.AAC.2